MNEYIEKGKEDEGKHLMRINVNVCGGKKNRLRVQNPTGLALDKVRFES